MPDTTDPHIAPSSSNTMARRALIEIDDNPQSALDYLSILSGRLVWPDPGEAVCVLRYVPDRLIIRIPAWQAYLKAAATDVLSAESASLEALAALILADTYDVTLARWMEVSVSSNNAEIEQTVVAGDAQPDWHNEGLLLRLEPIATAIKKGTT